jgi:ABC-2 type transport system ATP-binding protein
VQIIHQGQLILSESIAGLNQSMNTGILQVTTRLIPDKAVLMAIPGVISIEKITENQIRIHHRITDNPGKQIAEAIIAEGWELQELTPLKKSMEDIFIALTRDNDS